MTATPMKLIIPPGATTSQKRLRFAWHVLQKWQRHQNETVASLKASDARQWHREASLPRVRATIEAVLSYRKLVYPDPGADEEVPWAAAVEAIRQKPSSHLHFAGIDLDKCFEGQPQATMGLDPAEDFTTYTVVDPNSRYTVTASKIDADNVLRNEDCYVYDDKGASHFGATFEHFVDATPQAFDHQGVATFYALSNVVNDARYWYDNASQAIMGWFYRTSDFYYIRLRDNEDAETDSYNNFSNGTTYYCTIERTGETAAQMRIYSDAARTTLIDTLSVTIADGRRYRYVFGANSYNSASTQACSWDTENLDLNEGAAGQALPIFSERGIHSAVLGGLVVR